LFHNLSRVFGDPGLEYEKLPGNNVKEKIAMLFKCVSEQGMYQKLEEQLLKIPGFTDGLL
jgi:hypothetical protein